MAAPPSAAELLASTPLIAPSLLASDFANLQAEIQRLEEAGARVLHLDIMDGHFVPNLSFGVPVVRAIRRVTKLTLDVHLMISDPGQYIEAFRDAGADLLTIHVEAAGDTAALLERIRSLGAGVGIALNPPTPLESVLPYLHLCDLVLPMSVMPGFGGQQFQPIVLEKLRRLREQVGRRALIAIDGGIGTDTIGSCAEAGATLFVVGTALLGQPDYRKRIDQLLALAKSHADVVED